jgi:hypothetical protein
MAAVSIALSVRIWAFVSTPAKLTSIAVKYNTIALFFMDLVRRYTA